MEGGQGRSDHGVGERAAEDYANDDARARQHDLVRLGLQARGGGIARRVAGGAPAHGGMAGGRAGRAEGEGAAGTSRSAGFEEKERVS